MGRKGQEERSAGHAEHVAKVGAGRDKDVLERIGKGLAPQLDALVQDGQIVLQQHKVGGLFGHVHRRVHRDAHVGGVEGRGIVDAVAHVADHVAPLSAGPG